MKGLFRRYLKELTDVALQGDAREESFYPSLANALRENPSQFFAPVPPEVWEYRVGGYQVCEKWLKDRRERQLVLNDIRTYCRVTTAIKHTIDIQEKIDAIYPAVEEDTVSWQDILKT